MAVHDRRVVNIEESMWKESAVAMFEVPFQHYPGGAVEQHNLS
jgi:hypothetical protein